MFSFAGRQRGIIFTWKSVQFTAADPLQSACGWLEVIRRTWDSDTVIHPRRKLPRPRRFTGNFERHQHGRDNGTSASPIIYGWNLVRVRRRQSAPNLNFTSDVPGVYYGSAEWTSRRTIPCSCSCTPDTGRGEDRDAITDGISTRRCMMTDFVSSGEWF